MAFAAPSSTTLTTVSYTPTQTASTTSSASISASASSGQSATPLLAASTSTTATVFGADAVSRPSFFELIAADRLVAGLKPALKHCLQVLGRHHSWLSVLVPYTDELFYFLLFILERHYLKHYSAAFAENFYGLKRMTVRQNTSNSSGGSDSSSQQLTIRELDGTDRSRSLFFLIVVPWIKSRLDWYYSALSNEVNEDGFENSLYIASEVNEQRQDWAIKLQRMFVRVFPYLHAVYEGALFLDELRYLFEFSDFSSPFQRWCGIIIRRMSLADLMDIARKERERNAQSSSQSFWRDTGSGASSPSARVSFLVLLRGLVSRVSELFADYAKWALIVAVFSLRFVEWWYSPANRITAQLKLPVPPPPQIAPPSQAGAALLAGVADGNECVICKRPRVNPACTPSGYVFCYQCIHSYVSEHGRCPITERVVSLEQIRRIYEN